MAKMEQSMENKESESFAEKVERAKQLYCLYNNITFGGQAISATSRSILQKLA